MFEKDAGRRKNPWLHLDSLEPAAIWFKLRCLQESARLLDVFSLLISCTYSTSTGTLEYVCALKYIWINNVANVAIGQFSKLHVHNNRNALSLLVGELEVPRPPSFIATTVIRGSFRWVSEVSRNHSGFSLDEGCAPFRSQHFTRHIHSGLNGGVNWPLFRLKVKEM